MKNLFENLEKLDYINMDYLDISTSDLNTDLWDSDLDPTMQDHLKLSSDPDMHDWFLDRDSKIPQVILNDKLMTDAIIGALPIKTEHSYSLNSDGDSMPDSPNSLHNKMDDMDECYPAIPMQSAHKNNSSTNNNSNVNNSNNNNNNYINLIQSLQNNPNLNNINHNNNNNNNLNNNNLMNGNGLSLHSYKSYSHSKKGSDASSTTSGSDFEMDSDEATIKEEPLSPGSSCPPSPTQCGAGYTVSSVSLANIAAYTNSDIVFDHKNGTVQMSNGSQSLLKNSQVVLGSGSHRIVIPKVKMEAQSTGFGLPPTPPSSLPSDESEGNQSPEHVHAPLSPPAPATTSSRRTSVNNNSSRGYTNGSSSRQPIHTPLISTQPKGSTGTLMLTEEEKRTLLAEGYPIPTRLPLTKAEEKSLKKIRRKIKNKISAQESRRKKKEYMDQLERKVEILVSENSSYKKRVESLEDDKNNLMSQLARLQALVNKQNRNK